MPVKMQQIFDPEIVMTNPEKPRPGKTICYRQEVYIVIAFRCDVSAHRQKMNPEE